MKRQHTDNISSDIQRMIKELRETMDKVSAKGGKANDSNPGPELRDVEIKELERF
jgi:hypothetical protein